MTSPSIQSVSHIPGNVVSQRQPQNRLQVKIVKPLYSCHECKSLTIEITFIQWSGESKVQVSNICVKYCLPDENVMYIQTVC